MKTVFRFVGVALAAALCVSPLAAQSPGKSNSINNATATMTTDLGSFPVLAWSWGASQSGTQHAGGGQGTANFQDMSITRYADGQTPHFLTMLATGQPIERLTLERDTVRIVLKNVLVTSLSTGGSGQERTEFLTENISLNFGRIEFSVNGQTFCFDAANGGTC